MAKEFNMTRRKLLELVKKGGRWIDATLLGGLVGGTPWRVFDFVTKSRQPARPKASPDVRLVAAGDTEIGGNTT